MSSSSFSFFNILLNNFNRTEDTGLRFCIWRLDLTELNSTKNQIEFSTAFLPYTLTDNLIPNQYLNLNNI